MNDVFGLDRGSVQCAIDRNDRDLRLIAEHRAAFRETTKAGGVTLTDFARHLGVKVEDVNRFHMAIEEALGELFYDVTQEIEENTEEARHDLGEWAGSLDYIGMRR